MWESELFELRRYFIPNNTIYYNMLILCLLYFIFKVVIKLSV
jgi:hypothetical protein